MCSSEDFYFSCDSRFFGDTLNPFNELLYVVHVSALPGWNFGLFGVGSIIRFLKNKNKIVAASANEGGDQPFRDNFESSCFPCKSLKNKFSKKSRGSNLHRSLNEEMPGPSRSVSSPSYEVSCKDSSHLHSSVRFPSPELLKPEVVNRFKQFGTKSAPVSPTSLSPTSLSPTSLSPTSLSPSSLSPASSNTLTDSTLKPWPLTSKEIDNDYVSLTGFSKALESRKMGFSKAKSEVHYETLSNLNKNKWYFKKNK